jgi:site-specific recombinase XerD
MPRRPPTDEEELRGSYRAAFDSTIEKWEAQGLSEVSVRNYRKWARRLLAWLQWEHIPLKNLCIEDVERWLRRYKRHEPNTQLALRSAITLLLKLLCESGQIREAIPPLKYRGARPKRDPDIPEGSDVDRLLETARDQIEYGGTEALMRYTLLLVFMHTGLRASEVARLQESRARRNSSGELLSIRVKSKWGHDEDVQINTPLRKALKDWLTHRERLAKRPDDLKRIRKTSKWALSDFVFPGRSGKKPITYTQIYRHIQVLGKLARVKIHPHAVRHFFATTLLNRGVPVHDVQALMRHRNIASLNPYLHSSAQRQRDALEKLAG